ncbi:hypothetical protein HY636_02875 [Candidatus Woesearchaeota archaeon]|nr:hypothetical protein [Candidatus Woesearchaeota archaeon]
MADKEQIKTNALLAPCCEKCLKWSQFQEKCWVFWHGKKECSQKVENQDEWDYEKLLLR